ncbi:MAG: sensor histidine kinase [Draconibacterium sp.]
MARFIHNSGNYLLSIIESIFELSMLQSKQVKLRIDNFTIREIEKSLEFFIQNELSKYRKQDITYSFTELRAEQWSAIRSDKAQLTQLLTKLISNSVKYSDSGEITVGCRINRKTITFCVKDDGIGIAQDMHNVIFERFRQVDGSNTRRYEGIGLGLSICKEIADLLGGKIWVESEPSKGSRFYFELPLSPDESGRGNF